MRVLHCIGSLEAGGAEKQLKLLVTNSQTYEYVQHYVVCFNKQDTVDPILKNAHIIYVKRGHKWNVVSLWWRIMIAVIKVNPDLVHLWLPEIITIPAALTGFFTKKLIISAVRRVPKKNVSSKQYLRDRAKYLPYILSNKMVSNFLVPQKLSLFSALFNWKKGVVIPNGIDSEALHQIPTSQQVKQNGRFNIVFSGRFAPQKRLSLLLLAVKNAKMEGVPVQLHIFGTGPQKTVDLLKKQIMDLDLCQDTTLYGYSASWLEIAKACDVIALPTVSEGMSNVLSEAAVTGIPILTTNIPENTHLYTNNVDAVLVEVDSVEEISTAIYDMYNDPSKGKRLAEQAKRTLLAFSIEKMVETYISLYKNLTHKKNNTYGKGPLVS